MGTDLKPCPFCGRKVHMGCRPNNQAETEHIAFVACYCGGYSACAHKMAVATDASTAQKLVREEWNRRAAAMPEGGQG
jgi:Lar family restriction alleviation protein